MRRGIGVSGKPGSRCPHCLAGLVGDPIPRELRDSGAYGKQTHWRREIGIYSRELDRTVGYRCPDCGGEWR